MNKEFTNKQKILEWHQLVVKGLVNGLSFTARDGRTEQLDFWARRSNLFERFSKCVLNLYTDQSYEIDERELIEIAKEGYRLGT